MNQKNNMSIEKVALRWGIITFILLSVYFMLMKMLGWVHVIELRFLNAFIMIYGIYMAIKTVKAQSSKFGYFKGIGVGSLTALVAVALFSAFGLIYITVINPEFLEQLKMNEPLRFYLTGYIAIIQIFIEGSISGFFFSLIIMQWLKEPRIATKE